LTTDLCSHIGAAANDADLATAFIRVAGLVDPPQTLLRPGIVLRVLRNGLGPAPPVAHSTETPSGQPRPWRTARM
jgi:hypothetical protein